MSTELNVEAAQAVDAVNAATINIEWGSLLTSSNLIFFAPILACLFYGFMNRRGERSRVVESLPSVAISLGILGTFSGIFIGLMGFNEKEISNSIPQLLGGMKTAFATSLLGMATSIVLKIVYSWQDDNSLITSDDPIKSLQQIEAAVVSCFKSDEEYSLVSQVKLIRQELIDSRRETKVAFKEFADHFSKMASESLVSELQQVVDKFNVMLNDLVSESFKELSESTIRLNEWQQEYKITIEKNQAHLNETLQHIDELRKVFEEAVARLHELDSTFESIDESLTAISTSGTELDEHSKALARQNALLEESIRAVRDVGEKANTVLPEFVQKMISISELITTMHKDTDRFVEDTTRKLESGVKEITATLVGQSQDLQSTTREFVEKTTEELKADFDHLSKATLAHMQGIEKALEEELTKSLNSLAGAMTSLSRQFVSDYTPLTEKLRAVISIAETTDVSS
ncbi:MotA/TolQ/ExbB proton channel family protein [uncultured Pseudodesulfovibrio sp.]|uniref:MotA/TolQ/ExbB proton channel family protein n=1 Tax=uncultured Pseudodesulfovibrio sp. TaxID=2035858 RepID=UPI0029C7D75E|nr:MotA/TolQ/ExbB proton channel family protein [uncultured Pseudodesulfovibrio sp.]